MREPLLQTKLFIPPRRPQQVNRPPLLKRLKQGEQRKLTLISAPAGFGKTTLVTTWLAGQPTAWLSLDVNDNDPVRFLRYVTGALQTIDEQIGQTTVEQQASAMQVAGTSFSLTAALTPLINDLATYNGRLTLVLDDYHLITEPTIHDALIMLLDNLPPQMHLVLISRTTPPLALPRLRVRAQMTEITSDDLRFSGDDTAQFLQEIMGLELDTAAIAQLEARTEGWIASLQLAALALQGEADPDRAVQNFAGDHYHITDYLLEEVLYRQPAERQEFLLHTALLPRLSSKLCDTVLERTDSQQQLETLDQNNLFLIPLDNQRHWYRYHHLFAEFLQAHFLRTHTADSQTLYQRASRWFAEHDYVEEAIDLALTGGLLAQAAELIATHVTALVWQTGQLTTIQQWFDKLPDHIEEQYPLLHVARGWLFFTTGKWDDLDECLTYLEQLLETDFRQTLAPWLGQIYIMRAEHAIYRKDLHAGEKLFLEAKELTPADDRASYAMAAQGAGYIYRLNGQIAPAISNLQEAADIFAQTGNTAATLFALYDWAEALAMAGRLTEAKAIFQRMLDTVAHQPRPNPAVCSAYIGLAKIAREQNQFAEATHYLEQAIPLVEDSFKGFLYPAYACYAKLLQSQGKFSEAREAADKVQKSADRTATKWIKLGAQALEAKIRLQQGEVATAAVWSAAYQQAITNGTFFPPYEQHLAQIIQARLALAQQQFDTALTQLDITLSQAKQAGWGTTHIEVLILQALAYQQTGQSAQAMQCLLNALDLAQPEAFVRVFVDEGEPLARLLRSAITHGGDPLYIGQLQAAFLPTISATIPQPLLDPLTDRERQVLRLVAAGLSNPEIAQELILATGTIAKYTNTIFGKLSVRNRTEAAARAQELGLL